jgi:uncharacterized protein
MRERSVADVQVRVNGAPLPPTARLGLTKVTVNDDLQMASSFTLSLHSREWGERQNRNWADDGLFAIGATIEISLGYIGGPLDSLITGEITDIDVELDVEQSPSLTVTGYDFRHRLGRNTSIETYTNMTDSQIASQVIARNNLTPVVTATALAYDHVTQDNDSDLSFLQQRAERHGYEVTIEGRRVRFGPPATSQVIPLVFGAELLGFSASIAGSELYGRVDIFGMDLSRPRNQQEYKVSASVDRFAGTLAAFDKLSPRTQVITGGPATEAEARVLASSMVADLAARGVSGSGRCRGNGALRAGRMVAIAGVGKRFGGSYRVSSVTHAFSVQEGFTTNFRVIGSP